jgi:hypothetical protein
MHMYIVFDWLLRTWLKRRWNFQRHFTVILWHITDISPRKITDQGDFLLKRAVRAVHIRCEPLHIRLWIGRYRRNIPINVSIPTDSCSISNFRLRRQNRIVGENTATKNYKKNVYVYTHTCICTSCVCLVLFFFYYFILYISISVS